MRSQPMKSLVYAFRTQGKETWDSKDILSPAFLQCDKLYCCCSFRENKLIFQCNSFRKLFHCTFQPYVFAHFPLVEYMFLLWRKQQECDEEFFCSSIHYEDLSANVSLQCTPVIVPNYCSFAINQDIKFLLELATSVDMCKGEDEVSNQTLKTILKSLAMMSLLDLTLKNNSYLKSNKNNFLEIMKSVILEQLCNLPEKEVVSKVCSYINLDFESVCNEWKKAF